jgi:hypothetical protein
VDLEPDDVSGATALLAAIERQLPGIVSTADGGDLYLFYDPDGTTVPEQRFPFCTILTRDHDHDAVSRLDRDAATYRVNVGVDRRTYEDLLGPAPREPAGYGPIDTGHDYAATDVLMPNPLYAPMHWVSVVAPGERTRRALADLLAGAHDAARRRHERRGAAGRHADPAG